MYLTILSQNPKNEQLCPQFHQKNIDQFMIKAGYTLI